MRPSRVVLLLLGVSVAPALSTAQDATGRIFGTVYDPQGAVIPAVQITVTNTATQDARTTTTNKDGAFQVLALPIGNYKVTAEHPGFSRVISSEEKLLDQSGPPHRRKDAGGCRKSDDRGRSRSRSS